MAADAPKVSVLKTIANVSKEVSFVTKSVNVLIAGMAFERKRYDLSLISSKNYVLVRRLKEKKAEDYIFCYILSI